jgi:hypothetical protein
MSAEAIATFLAAFVALGFGMWSEIRLHSERSSRVAAEERTQALKVSAWIEAGDLLPDEHAHEAYIVVFNASNEPVWKVHAGVPAADPDDVPTMSVALAIVPPGATIRERARGAVQDTGMPLELTFKDSAERWWTRDRDGMLSRVEIRPDPQDEYEYMDDEYLEDEPPEPSARGNG